MQESHSLQSQESTCNKGTYFSRWFKIKWTVTWFGNRESVKCMQRSRCSPLSALCSSQMLFGTLNEKNSSWKSFKDTASECFISSKTHISFISQYKETLKKCKSWMDYMKQKLHSYELPLDSEQDVEMSKVVSVIDQHWKNFLKQCSKNGISMDGIKNEKHMGNG